MGHFHRDALGTPLLRRDPGQKPLEVSSQLWRNEKPRRKYALGGTLEIDAAGDSILPKLSSRLCRSISGPGVESDERTPGPQIAGRGKEVKRPARGMVKL